MLRNLLIVGSGGFIGSILRYLVQLHVEKLMSSTFPAGTMVVNITGSFILGMVYALAEKGDLMSPGWRIFLAIGICGGFTTFSTFSLDNINLIKDNSLYYLLLYTGGSVLSGVLAVYLGIVFIRLIF